MSLPIWQPHASVWLILGSIVAGYLIALRRHERATGEAPDGRRTRLFLSGVGVLVLGAEWPIHELAERYLFVAHMTQHLLFTLVAPPLLIAGMPAWLLRSLLRNATVTLVFRFLTRPIVALLAFNAVLLFTHWPAVVEASVRSEWIHLGLHVVIVATALMMWWPLMSPLPELPALSAPGQMVYLFLQSLAPTIPASFLTFGDHLLYPVYGTFPRIWGIDALTDQLLAGLVMKLIGGMILWGFIAVIFFRWHAQERAQDGWDPTALAGVEREIRAGAIR